MRATWRIAIKDLSLRLRDRSVFIIGLIAPLALAYIFSLVFGGSLNDVGEQITLEMGAVIEDSGPIGQTFGEILASIDAQGFIDLVRYEDLAAAEQAVEDGTVGAIFHVPADLSTSIEQGADVQIDVIGNVDAPTTTDIAASIAKEYVAGVTRANLSALTAVGTGVLEPERFIEAATEAGNEAGLVQLGELETEVRQLDSSTFFVAGLSIFFMFFVAGLSVTSMLEERRDGTLGRLIAAPISRASIVAGKSLTSVIIGLVSMTVLVVASGFVMDADWGPPLGVAMLVLAAILAVVGIMTLVGGLAHTPEQAGNLQSVVAVSFAMLGGTFVPISGGDGILASLQYATPNAWFMRGLSEMASGDVAAGIPAATVLFGIALVSGVIGSIVVGKAVRP